ncbi:MAG: hypothetical protein PWQ37_2542 [Candidatus Petromonas sp.]|jgi:hypothetical protein|nr:hypothetical protein [Candidatus Petromonas sp.]
MRNIESVSIERAIVHILDKNSDTPILAEIEQDVNEEVHEFLTKHIIKSLKDDDNRKAKFKEQNGIVKESSKKIFLDNNNFIEESRKIANHMFRIMKSNSNISSADLVICIFASDNEKYIGILKLDYQKSYIHEIEYIDDGFLIKIIPQDIGLPGINQKLQKCAFIRKLDEENDYDMIILDKQSYAKNSEVAQFFIDEFLNSEIIIDNRDKTKILKSAVEKWTRKALKDDFEKAMEVRNEINNTLKNEEEVDIEEISNNVFKDDTDLKNNFVINMKDKGIEPNDTFKVDQNWVSKKMKKKTLKTDSGFEVRGNFEDFEDDLKFQIRRNGDGTVDLVVRNVRNIIEK